MPFYTYENEKKERIEIFVPISEMKDEIEKEGIAYKRVPEFCMNYKLSWGGTRGSKLSDLGSPTRSKEVGIKVDYDKKARMEAGYE